MQNGEQMGREVGSEMSDVNLAIGLTPSVLGGGLKIPSSKSVGHRLLICAALARGESQIYELTRSKDINATMAALRKFGASFEESHDLEGRHYWKVIGINARRGNHCEEKSVQTLGLSGVQTIGMEPAQTIEPEAVQIIECGESGSTLRFLIPVGMAIFDELCFNGEGRLVERPIDEYFPILKASGVQVDYSGKLPLHLKGRLLSGRYELSGAVSSQYTTGMIFAAPLLTGDTEIQIIGEMESKAYIDLTIESLRLFGIRVERRAYHAFKIKGEQQFKPQQVVVEGDYSQAAFWIVAGLIGTNSIAISGLNPNSVQGDRMIIELVRAMGGILEWEGNVLKVHPSQTKGIEIDAAQCPDLIPVLCVLAALSEGETNVVNGKRLRFKESDRITATVTELKRMGATIEETTEGITVKGVDRFRGGCVIDGWNDHRIVMSMAIASTRCMEPIVIEGFRAIEKSYPTFFEDFERLGGVLEMVKNK